MGCSPGPHVVQHGVQAGRLESPSFPLTILDMAVPPRRDLHGGTGDLIPESDGYLEKKIISRNCALRVD